MPALNDFLAALNDGEWKDISSIPDEEIMSVDQYELTPVQVKLSSGDTVKNAFLFDGKWHCRDGVAIVTEVTHWRFI